MRRHVIALYLSLVVPATGSSQPSSSLVENCEAMAKVAGFFVSERASGANRQSLLDYVREKVPEGREREMFEVVLDITFETWPTIDPENADALAAEAKFDFYAKCIKGNTPK